MNNRDMVMYYRAKQKAGRQALNKKQKDVLDKFFVENGYVVTDTDDFCINHVGHDLWGDVKRLDITSKYFKFEDHDGNMTSNMTIACNMYLRAKLHKK